MTTNSVTSKQLEILILLYRFRFLTRIHIQQFLNHKNHTRITPWLKDLTDKQLINRIYSPTIGEINKPAICYLANKSRQLLKDNQQCNSTVLNRVYREKHRSQAFREHCLFMADLFFHFKTAAMEQQAECHFYTATDLSEVVYAPLPLPDAYITVTDNQNTKRYFLDVFDDKTPMFAVRKRIEQYCRYYQANYWQDHNRHPFPTILLICPTLRIKQSLLRLIPKTLNEEGLEISFYLGLKTDIQQHGITVTTWEAVL